MAKITLIGDINIDVILSVPYYPGPGEDATAQEISIQPGGSVANTAVVLRKLALEAQLVSRTGADPWAREALAAIASQGVDIARVHQDPTLTTGLIFIPVTAEGERTMFSYRGANVHLHPDEVEAGLFADSHLLHISGYNFLVSPQREATLAAVAYAEAAGLPISLDVGLVPAREAQNSLTAILPKLALCVLGPQEAIHLIGTSDPQKAAAALLAQGVKRVGYKLGGVGCLVADAASRESLPAFAVETVDTTGAGDAFCAGFIYGWVKGLSLPAAGVLANALGALATSVWGGGPGLPGRLAAIGLLQDQKGFPPHDRNLPAIEEALQALTGLKSQPNPMDSTETDNP